MSTDLDPFYDLPAPPYDPNVDNLCTDESLHFCVDFGIGSMIDELDETADGWSLNSFQISKKRAEYRAGYTFGLSPEARLYKRWFDFPDLGRKGWAIIFRRWDHGSNAHHPGAYEQFPGWVPPEREKEADYWISFLNQEIRARLREAGKTPTEPDPAHGGLPPPAPPGR